LQATKSLKKAQNRIKGKIMEDDEEYYYTAYSKKTAREMTTYSGCSAMTGDEEDYSFKGFSESALSYAQPISATAQTGDVFSQTAQKSAISEDDAIATALVSKSYGDFIVEEFSAEQTAKKVTRLIKLNETTVNYIMSFLDLCVGTLILAMYSHIGNYFSYIVGSFMAVIGLGQFIYAVRTKEYVHTHSNKTAMSLILMALALLILIERESANTIIAIAWGFLGLLEGAHAFNHAFSRMARHKRFVYYLVKGSVEVVLAFMLLHDPINHLETHIIVLGVNLIFDAVTMFPPIKKRLSKK
jgi:uncharacterized membrane protein HdeD (DUF308 family)